MILTPEQQAILSGSKGETMAKVMKTLVMYGETFGADKLVPVTSEYNHLVTSFGLKMMKPVFDLMQQLIDWTVRVEEGLKASGNKKVLIPTVFTTAPAVKKEFEKAAYAEHLKATGVVLSYICPLMYMNNPLAGKMPVITCSNKLRTYTTARFYTEEEILAQITKGGN